MRYSQGLLNEVTLNDSMNLPLSDYLLIQGLQSYKRLLQKNPHDEVLESHSFKERYEQLHSHASELPRSDYIIHANNVHTHTYDD